MAGISQKLKSERKTYVLRPNAEYLNIASVIHAWCKNSQTVVEFS